jgi:hypothetical protein
MRVAGDTADEHGLRGYEATHLAAARHIGADVFSSADRRLCSAASESGLHVANPIGTSRASAPVQLAIEPDRETPMITLKHSGVLGVPIPLRAAEDVTDHYPARR